MEKSFALDVSVLEDLEATTKRTEKEKILKRADEPTREFIKLALDQNITFGVTAWDDEENIKVWKRANSNGFDVAGLANPSWEQWFMKQLKAFQTRELTGNLATAMVQLMLERAHSPLHAKWAGRIINRNLRAGFDINTYNKVFGGEKIDKFAIQLAEAYEGGSLQGIWYVQPKLDGNRVVLIDGKALSRGNKEYTAAQYIIDEFPKGFFDKWVVDGEMMGNLGFDQSSGALRRLSDDGRKKAEFTYWAFDLIDRKEWEKRQTKPLNARTFDLENVIGKLNLPHVKFVPTSLLEYPTHTDLMEACDRYVNQGFEGAMVKQASSPYVFKRGSNLLKVKKFYDADLKVVDFYEGKGKYKGSLGGFYVEGKIDGKPIRSKVGSGFDDDLRGEIWDSQRKWRGAIVQVQYQEITPLDPETGFHSLRFPVFIMRRKDKE